MPYGICRLCGLNAELKLSHIVPAFIYRWLRESSGNGHIRRIDKPNRRVQDGVKEYWLCETCEMRFNRHETAFSQRLFHPYLRNSGSKFHYGPWLLGFCTSVSWRNLLLQLDRGAGEDFTEAAREKVKLAENTWRNYLLDRTPHPGVFRQHLLPLDRIKDASSGLPPNINRYLMRAIDIDLCHGGETIFVYTKMGRFIILGFISEPRPGEWVGTKVNANRGVIEPRRYVLPAAFLTYITGKAERAREVMGGISDKQSSKIEEVFRSNVDRIARSDFFKAMQADVEMFGHDAFTPENGSSGER